MPSNIALQDELDDKQKLLIAGAVAEVDLRQMMIMRSLTPSQRFQQGLSMIQLAEQVGTYRLRMRQPELEPEEALRRIRRRP